MMKTKFTLAQTNGSNETPEDIAADRGRDGGMRRDRKCWHELPNDRFVWKKETETFGQQ